MDKAVLIGAGNVAHSLGPALINAKVEIAEVYSRKPKSASELAGKLGAKPVTATNEITKNAQYYFICVPDDAIAGVSKELNLNRQVVMHTSGNTDIAILNSASENYGVFYPLQTFTKDRPIEFTKVPICIEANNEHTKQFIERLAVSLSENVHYISSESRQLLHISAVFANNFSNHMVAIAEDIASKEKLPDNLLKPLLKETFIKIMDNNALSSQTGPAKRNDFSTTKSHLQLLSKYPEYQKIYTLVSESISKTHGN